MCALRLNQLRHNARMNRRPAALAALFLGALGAAALGVAAFQRTQQPDAARRTLTIASLPKACAFGPDLDATLPAGSTRQVLFLAGATLNWRDQPVRLADWVASKQSLLIVSAGKNPSLDTLSLYLARTGADEPAGERRSDALLPRWSEGLGRATEQQDFAVDAAVLNQPRISGSPLVAPVSSAIRVLMRPGSTQSLVFGSQQAVLADSASGSCTLTVNWGGAADLPLIDAAWSSDGRFLAVLMMADSDRLGPTTLRIVDMTLGQWRTAPQTVGAISALRWRPASHDLYVTLAHPDVPDRLDTFAAIDADTLSLIEVDAAPVLFAPSYWGFVFGGDGRVLYAACGVPDSDAVLRSNALCQWTVTP